MREFSGISSSATFPGTAKWGDQYHDDGDDDFIWLTSMICAHQSGSSLPLVWQKYAVFFNGRVQPGSVFLDLSPPRALGIVGKTPEHQAVASAPAPRRDQRGVPRSLPGNGLQQILIQHSTRQWCGRFAAPSRCGSGGVVIATGCCKSNTGS